LTVSIASLIIEYMTRRAADSLVTLGPEESARVLAAHPELTDGGERTVVVAFTVRGTAQVAALSDLLHVLRERTGRAQQSREQIAQALLPAGGLSVSRPVNEQLRRAAEAKAALAQEFGLVGAAAVADQAGSRAANRSALASRWSSEGRIFGVEIERGVGYVGFQFDDAGRPRPVVASVLAAVGGKLGGWELALWFTSANGWLGGARPVDVLEEDPESIVEAAARLADEILP
jgi:hypothetical protein